MNKIVLILLCFISVSLSAQDDLMNMLEDEVAADKTPEKVFATFKGTKLINANTIETTKKKTLKFDIAHRFGNIKIGNPQGKHTLWGLDNASNIRFSFGYGLTDKLSIGIGRSKTKEHIDGNLKFRFLEQKTKGIPISVAYFANVAITPVAGEIDFVNRLSFTHQLIIASKITRSLSLEVLPTLVHRNFVDQTILHPDSSTVDENDVLAIGFAGRIKISKRVAFVVDYFFTVSDFRDVTNGYYDAVGVGIEIETGGHVFHINLTNSSGLIENDFIPDTRDAALTNYPFTGPSFDDMKLGFNISRVFSF